MMRNRLLLLSTLLLSTSSYFLTQNLENLGEQINTPLTDCYPVITPDGQTLFFSIDGPDKGKGKNEIYSSELDDKGNWGKAKPVKEFNNANKNVIYHISPDGNEVYLLGDYQAENENGLSISKRTEKGWTDPVKIKFENENSITWGNNACTLSPNGNVMILSLKGDLHVSFLKENDVWSHPKVLAGSITTSSNEFSPFLGLDNKTLYFSGGGHGGLGSNDIFKSTRLDDTWLNWSTPENLGEPVNSSNWESFFRLTAKGDYAYVYSRATGDGDIFRIKLKEEVRPNPVVLVKGKVIDSKTKEVIKSASINYELLSDGRAVGIAKSNPETGEYKIILPYGSNYSFSAKSQGYIAVSENLDLSKVEVYKEITKDLYLSPLEVGAVVRINNIFFDVAAATLRVESNPELNKVAKLLSENPTMKIEIAGHTDSDGGEVLNKTLSQGRAKSVMEYLISQGVDKSRIVSVGFGESKPLVENSSEENKQLNRRVEFRILSK